MTNQNTNDYLEKIKLVQQTSTNVLASFVCLVTFWDCCPPPAGLLLHTTLRLSSRQRLFENLRMLPHAPGVQMQAIPEDAAQEDSGDEEEEDPNKRISSER